MVAHITVTPAEAATKIELNLAILRNRREWQWRKMSYRL